TAHRRLPTANCLLLTADCLLPTAYCRLPTASCRPPTAGTLSCFDQTGESIRDINKGCRAAADHTKHLVESEPKIRKIAFLGDYLPRKCGIATFTSDLLTSVETEYPQSQCFAVPVNDVEEGYDYPGVVRFEIAEQDLSSYQRAADFLNISNVDMVSVQHEFGIYGGPAGRHLLALVRELTMPVV